MKFKHVRRRLSWPITFAFAWFFVRLLQLLPHSALPFLGNVAGSLVFLIPKYRQIICENMAVVLPDADEDERKAVGKRSIQNISRTFLELFWMQRHHDRLDDLVQFSPGSEAVLQEYEEKEQGVILMSMHIGNWELANVAINKMGHRTYAVVRRQPNPGMDSLISSMRSSSGAKIIYEEGAAKRMFSVLRSNGTIVILNDQNTAPHKGGMFVELFGMPISISRAPFRFAQKTKSEILIGIPARDENGCLIMHIEALPKATAEYETEEALAQAVTNVHEKYLWRFMDQYLWMYRRFRYIPTSWQGDRSRFPSYARDYDG